MFDPVGGPTLPKLIKTLSFQGLLYLYRALGLYLRCDLLYIDLDFDMTIGLEVILDAKRQGFS